MTSWHSLNLSNGLRNQFNLKCICYSMINQHILGIEKRNLEPNKDMVHSSPGISGNSLNFDVCFQGPGFLNNVLFLILGISLGIFVTVFLIFPKNNFFF